MRPTAQPVPDTTLGLHDQDRAFGVAAIRETFEKEAGGVYVAMNHRAGLPRCTQQPHGHPGRRSWRHRRPGSARDVELVDPHRE